MKLHPFLLTAVAALAVVTASGAQACTATANSTSAIGPYSPAAIKGSAVPSLSNKAGLNCPPAVLVLLTGNYIRATFSSANGFKLKPSSGTDVINYTASADSGATVAFTQGGTVDYTQNNLLNLLGLLGGSSGDLPFYVKPTSTAMVAEGTYTDVVTINWSWNLCTGIGALGACIGTLDTGTATTKVTVSLSATAKPVVLSVASSTTWDPISGTLNPKALPGGRWRRSASLSNPDIVALDNNAVVLNLPTPSGAMIALDGDGTGSGSVFQVTQGGTASALTLSYVSPSSTTDDVDFSNDNGATWTYVPVAGDSTTQAAVTNIRLKFKGSMAASSSLSVSVPYSVK